MIGTHFFVRAILLALIFSSSAFAEGEPGRFDYYLFTLSWSPEHCSEARHDSSQCGTDRHYSFVVHGLWPQYEKGYPESCSTSRQIPENVVEEMQDIMPSRHLIKHEWQKHGTCSGLKVKDYFGLIKKQYSQIKIPDEFADPNRPITIAPQQIKSQFEAANPGMQIVVACKGRYLQEVRICYDRQMRPRECGANIRSNCRNSKIIVRPVK